MLVLALGAVSAVPDSPDPATLIYYNARLALRDGEPTEALRLWLLRNALFSKTGHLSKQDGDFLSATWVALGELGLCQDGVALDHEGAGLWPVALHNWFIKNMRRTEPGSLPAPFDAFDLPVQQRHITLTDVLSIEELDTVRFVRTSCYRMKDVLASAGQSSRDDPSRREVQLRVLTYLLEASRHTLSDQVRGQSVIEARLLDIRLKQVDELDRKTRQARRLTARQLETLGTKPPSAPDVARSPDMLALLSVTRGWTAEDWMALDPERRLYLYRWVQRAGLHEPSTHLDIVDRLIDQHQGEALTAWLGLTASTSPSRTSIWAGARGQSLLGLQRSTGFRERSVIALHRGVQAVGAGDLASALRSFAYALHYVSDSTQAEAVRRLSLRWLSFVVSQYEVTDELVTLLVTLVPRTDLARILEDLMWTAALNADRPSFDRAVRAHQGRGALLGRSARLAPLASGDLEQFMAQLEADLAESPHVTLRFLRLFLERLETEEGEVRAHHSRTLRLIREQLAGQEEILQGSLSRRAATLHAQCDALLDGLPQAELADDIRGRTRALSPRTEVFVGSIRMAPSDPLPWPFETPDVQAPSVFTPLPIQPVEWQQGATWTMGWKLGQ